MGSPRFPRGTPPQDARRRIYRGYGRRALLAMRMWGLFPMVPPRREAWQSAVAKFREETGRIITLIKKLALAPLVLSVKSLLPFSATDNMLSSAGPRAIMSSWCLAPVWDQSSTTEQLKKILFLGDSCPSDALQQFMNSPRLMVS